MRDLARTIQKEKELIEIGVLGALLALVQVLDGVLTAVGVQTLGLNAEGNIFLRQLMHKIGCIPTLALTKTAALVIVCILCWLATKVKWLPKVFRGVIVLYLLLAIVPWSVILIIYGVL